MTIPLPELPYDMDALQSFLSKETLEYHYGKHHKAYVDKLNALISGTKFDAMPLDEILLASVGDAKVFNNAAQAWNHTFYWNGLAPQGGGDPKGAMADALKKSFGSFAEFVKKFADVAAAHFGSGWAWLVRNGDSSLDIVATHDAANPMTDHLVPLLTCDLWEHAYYIDYRNDRAMYLQAFWKQVHWDFVEKNLQESPKAEPVREVAARY